MNSEIVSTKGALRWSESDGAVTFSVTSDGTTGEQWIKRFEAKHFRTGPYVQEILLSPDFQPTSGVTTKVVVLKGKSFGNIDRTTETIRFEAARRQFVTPNAEVACLISEYLSSSDMEEMGLTWIVIMHEPIVDSFEDPYLLIVDLFNGDDPGLEVRDGRLDVHWISQYGFAFAATQA